MLKLAIIGTGWISEDFVKASLSTQKYELTAVYSRSLEKAENFAQKFDSTKTIKTFSSLDDFFKDDFDLVYIASPNSLHFEHAKKAIKANKNLIVEKPAFSNPDQLDHIIKLSEINKVHFFEAARNIHEKSYKLIADFLSDKTITGVDFTYAKYSSKMKDLLSGQTPNTFSAKFSGGALADLGVYILYASAYFFGQPNKSFYNATLLDTGVDINGVGVLDYGDFRLALKTGKNLTSNLPAEIYTTDGTLTLDEITSISFAKFKSFDGQEITLDISQNEHAMAEEADDFADILNNPKEHTRTYEKLLELARIVSATSFAMRQDAGIIFEADKK